MRKQDIHTVSTQLIPTLTQSMQAALQGQLKPPEQVFIPPCHPTVASDHPIGAEATHVKVAVSQTCSAVAYTSQELEAKATDLLTRQAGTKTGASNSLLGTVKVRVTQATIKHTPAPLVFLSFQATGNWIYGLSNRVQEHIKSLIAGRTKERALQLVALLKGVENATISWGNVARLPKDTKYIHIRVLVV